MLSPKKTKFYKQHKRRIKGISYRGNCICFGKYAIKALKPSLIKSKQIESGRQAIIRNTYHNCHIKVWVRIFPDKPVTLKPIETRMGSGKGAIKYWITFVKPGTIIFELSELPKKHIAKKIISIIKSKLPIKTKLIKKN
uniref:ribosomal protein L16 n=1 Tax=Sarcophyte sanguinea TaxID=1618143 RepID=UPI0026E2E2D7|nr:ribosomal protein L16 [Sarcophyte sanguinea]WJE89099.1 ribosomal protein L16 [Sarcophyte sanguinea]WJE89118.1 ribosomal protein L16 [Sarcophyte sanguinea]